MSTDPRPLLVAHEVARHHLLRGREVVALRPVSLQVDEGDVVAVTGPSGTGKSTLASLLAGWDQPSSGRVEHPRGALRTAFVPQRVVLLPTLSVADNLALATGPDEGPRSLAAVAAALRVDHLLARFPTETSLGERQRIGLARALRAGVDLLVLDEPTAHQDVDHTAVVLAALTRPGPGRAVLFTTHDPALLPHATRQVRLLARDHPDG